MTIIGLTRRDPRYSQPDITPRHIAPRVVADAIAAASQAWRDHAREVDRYTDLAALELDYNDPRCEAQRLRMIKAADHANALEAKAHDLKTRWHNGEVLE